MRTKLLSILILLTVAISYAQTTASAAGIAIQGIARNENNTAKVNETLTFTFRIYYGSNVQIYEDTKTVTTDAFGVFSIVLEPGETNNIVIANTQAFLKISEGTTIISDEKLKQVPYAIAASNGVPTGSIMPYIGTTAPAGWAMCDGSAFPTDASGAALKVFFPDGKTPNLQGTFLRGTGTSPVNNQAGPGLKGTQGDDFKGHNHSASVNDPGHTHEYGDIFYSEHGGTVNVTNNYGLNGGSDNDNKGFEIKRTSDNSLTKITVSTGNTGGSETRPVNYGVNYIIKL
jgi:microcystin-dependent protein